MSLCPICNQEELGEDGWCAVCRGLTAEEPPEGFAWVVFQGGPLNGVGRMIEADFLRLGNLYELAWTQPGESGRYAFDGKRFVFASTIAETAPADAHWFRGAEYIPEGDDS